VATRRLPLSAVLVATALALVAAVGTSALLDRGNAGGDDGASGDVPTEGYEMTPAGELPASVAAVRLTSLDGGPDAALGDLFTGTPVVVNFFASWCAPCIDEMPAFEAVHQSLGGRVTFLGMANRDTPDDARATMAATGITYPAFGDPDTSALTYFGGLAMPTTVFIGPDGVVRDVHSGALTEEALRGKLTELFGVTA